MLKYPMFIFYYFLPQFVVGMLLLKVCNAAFLYTQGYDKWYLGLIPFAHIYYKHDLSGTLIIWFILDSIFGFFALLTFNIFIIVIWWILRSIADYKYASIFVDDYDPLFFSAIPMWKYGVMIKEVINYARNESR